MSSAEPAEPRLAVHSFHCKHQASIIHFQVLRLKQSFLLWISDSPCFRQLAVAMPGLAGQAPAVSVLLNQSGSGESDQLASRLARRTGKQVYVSSNISMDQPQLRHAVEARIVEEMKEHPDMF